MTNPLLAHHELPAFSQIQPEHVIPAIDFVLAEARATVERQLSATQHYSWENLVEPLEEMDNLIHKTWSPVSHLNSVMNSDELRDAYNACLPKLSEYSTEMGQNEQLYRAFQDIRLNPTFTQYTDAQKKIIDNSLRDFKLSGVALSDDKKTRYKAISQELSQLASKFEENVLDATNAWTKLFDNEQALAGLPPSALIQARQAAEHEGKQGWMITLQFPSYHAIMTYADNRELRREHYAAYCTRASDQGPDAGKWDNTEVMENILALRHEKAQLLGFDSYAELSLATKMADSADEVLNFLEDLAAKSLPQAKQDLVELSDFAKASGDIDDLQPWDIGYFSEKMRQHRYELSQEEVKAYFPVTRVLPGLFSIVEKLYGLKIKDIKDIKDFDTWHPDVHFYEIRDKDNILRGRFYLDLYARPKKRGGAWMDDCLGRKKMAGSIQTPVAYLTCNFTPPAGSDPALLTHDEVTTLFHEFGHGLHHMLTQVDYLGVSGINGVEWDAVELPSQFMENWCWEKESLMLLSGHYQTGEKLPDDLFEKMLAAKNFQSGMMMVRQLEFSIFDFLIHLNYRPEQGGRIYETLNQVRDRVAVVKPPQFNRFAHSFGHIFAGGYGAGYYSYKWAEVLSSDAFSLFEEKGIFNAETGKAFLSNILERGGSKDAMELFVNFRGRKPNIDALLRHNGIGVAA
jgi:oligopeptidase A